MATIKSVQYGTATIANANASTTASITAVDTSKAYIVLSTRVNTAGQSNAGRSIVGATFTSTTQITFTRQQTGGTGDLTLTWYVVEYTSGVTVQRGTSSNVNRTGTNITITAVTVARAFPIIYTIGDVSWDYGGNVSCAADITTTTNLNVKSGYDTPTNTVYWQVVENEDATVAKYEGTMADGNQNTDVTITSVDMSKTFLVGGIRRAASSSAYGSDENNYNWKLTTATNIRLQRQGTYESYYYVIYTVALSRNCAVQRNDSTISGGATTATPTITSVTLASTYAQVCSINGHLSRPSDGASAETDAITEIKLNSSTQLNLQRQTTGTYDAYVSWEVIDLTASAGTRICTVQSGTTTLAAGTATTTAAITSIDTAKSWIVFTTKGSGSTSGSNEPGNASVCGSIDSSTQISFKRISSDMGVSVQWFVITFSTGMTVQRGTDSNVGTTAVNKTITAIDTSKTFVVHSVASNTSCIYGQSIKADLSTTTNLALQSQDGAPANECRWQVIQYNNCSVQKITKSLSSESSSTSAVTSVDTSKTFLAHTARHADSSNLQNRFWHFRLSDATTITYERNATDNYAFEAITYVVSFTDSATVSRYKTAIGSGDTTTNVTVSPSIGDTSSAWIFGQDHSQKSSIDADSWWYITDEAKAITSTTNVACTRVSSGQAGNTYFEVIEHTATTGSRIAPKWQHYRLSRA